MHSLDCMEWDISALTNTIRSLLKSIDLARSRCLSMLARGQRHIPRTQSSQANQGHLSYRGGSDDG